MTAPTGYVATEHEKFYSYRAPTSVQVQAAQDAAELFDTFRTNLLALLPAHPNSTDSFNNVRLELFQMEAHLRSALEQAQLFALRPAVYVELPPAP